MQYAVSLCRHARLFISALLLLLGTVAAHDATADSYDPVSKQLTLAVVGIGNAYFYNVVVSVGTIVSGPQGVLPIGSVDFYIPASKLLTVQTVTVGSTTYNNVVITVAQLASVGSIAGADTYDGTHLTIPVVQVGSTVYTNVVITVGSIIGVTGQMPTLIQDEYEPTSRKLTIPAVQFGGRVYTNVNITVGKIDYVGGAQHADTTLYSFTGGVSGSTDGSQPSAGLIMGSDGNFYGTTGSGGAYGYGCVFKITPTGTESVVYSFHGADGLSPGAGLIQAKDGTFYGTTTLGGVDDGGTVFKITPAGVETVLHAFTGYPGSTDGDFPNSLIQISDGNLFGTTESGGANNTGVIFRVTPDGAETVIHSFSGELSGSTDGAWPNGLIQGVDGNLYGTTSGGGFHNTGTVFKVTAVGVVSILYSFSGTPFPSADGAQPAAGVIQGSDGNLYGTTATGGAYGVGTVFKVTSAGIETVLHSFSGFHGSGVLVGTVDGASPLAALIEGSDGNFYGTTNMGGAYDAGSVFSVTPNGIESVLYYFSGNDGISGSLDGANPSYAGLLQGSDGNLYGTTLLGGPYQFEGTVFVLPNAIPIQ